MSAVWSQGKYARIAELFTPIHDDFVARMAPAAGERWLDVGTGTGAVAVRAAQAGADVTAIDIAEAMLAQARANADVAGVDVQWDLGDAQDLPYDAAAFLQRVGEARRDEVRDAFVEYFRRFETPDGVREPRSYLFVHGRRR